MKAMRELAAQPMFWTHHRVLRCDYDLYAGDAVVATLRWGRMIGSLATAAAAEGSWTFERSGFLRPRVTVRVAGTQTDLAILKPHWPADATLEFGDGRRYRWTHAGFWRTEWIFATEAGEALVRVKPRFALRGNAADVAIEPSAGNNPDLSLLVTLAWYLVVLMSQHAGGVTAAAAAAAAG
jgi:hypothetical protein